MNSLWGGVPETLGGGCSLLCQQAAWMCHLPFSLRQHSGRREGKEGQVEREEFVPPPELARKHIAKCKQREFCNKLLSLLFKGVVKVLPA